MPFSLSVHHGLPYLLVRAQGTTILPDLWGAADLVARVAERTGQRRVLIDLSEIDSRLSFTDHLQLGTHVAEVMHALDRVATVASVRNRSGASEKAAQRSGLRLRTFLDLTEAHGWLQEPAAAGDPPPG